MCGVAGVFVECGIACVVIGGGVFWVLVCVWLCVWCWCGYVVCCLSVMCGDCRMLVYVLLVV